MWFFIIYVQYTNIVNTFFNLQLFLKYDIKPSNKLLSKKILKYV